MANSEIETSTNNTLGGEYQVFLNFRGPDTRDGITNVLYHILKDAGIHIFLDDEELRPGDIFSDSLQQAIDDSQIYITIFSPRYASSHWCLRELAMMVKNISISKGGNKKVILPIFYNVTPSDVKLKTGSYQDDISKWDRKSWRLSWWFFGRQRTKFDTEVVDTWRDALRQVNETMGWQKHKFTGDGHLSMTVAMEVVDRLRIKRRIVTEDLVGIEDPIKAIKKLVGMDSDGKYQVFLSFRGPDTRTGFTDILYHVLVNAGVHVFIEKEDIQMGEDIEGSLLRAIDDSKLYIPIFSSNYASSRFCLQELARMVDNTFNSEDGDKKVILPIYYDVEPSDVRLQTGLYKQAILQHEKNSSSADVEKWQLALRRVGGISGFTARNASPWEMCKSVVNEVVATLEKRKVPIDSDVRLIGIYGMTGIGKSTLAKSIFNELYPHFWRYCSFLDDVSERTKTKGLVKLQKQLLSDMSNSRVARIIEKIDHGTKAIGETICNKKALIVLDDVDDVNQIQGLIKMDSLCSGTRILVTTRDKRVLNIKGFEGKIEHYEMEGLSKEDACRLFKRHAFYKESPPLDYHTLLDDIVSTAGGLPLALETIGSSLFLQQERKIWEAKLRKTPHRNVLGKLRISYDALEVDQQQIFLDVACFFIDESKNGPIYVWRDCGFSPEDAIDVLINRCMIKITDDNRFKMHNQFRDLGRTIANQERSRLWARDDIICELNSTEIKGSVQALRLLPDSSIQHPITITAEQIKRFPHLRFLWLRGVTCQGDFTGCLRKLKWISMSNQDEVSSLIKGATRLKVLTLQNSDLQTLGQLPSNLTVLELSHGQEQQVTLDGLVLLEKLTVKGCERLERLSIPSSLRKNLKDLSIEGCESLQVVEGIDELEVLQWLKVKGCGSVERIIDALRSKIPNECKISITDSGKLLDTAPYGSSITCKSYREKILNGPIPASKL